MTKKLDEELNLPDLLESLEKQKENNKNLDLEYEISNDITEKIDNLKKLRDDILKNKYEIDKILEEAIEDYKKIMFLAFSSEPKISGQILEPAVELLKTILDNKQKFIEQKLSIAKLELYKEKNEAISKQNKDFKNDGLLIVERNKILDLIQNKEEKNDDNK
ncbi:MAG: hypothetical protein NZZ41_00420 [Candidatus Dojkabacteria bacterium]|nr:hypothetical protein [Candidatus Dojkabacteria bacterium]